MTFDEWLKENEPYLVNRVKEGDRDSKLLCDCMRKGWEAAFQQAYALGWDDARETLQG